MFTRPAILRLLFSAIVVLSLPAFTSQQPVEERQAQEKLPQAKDKLWDELAATKFELVESKGPMLYKARFSNTVKGLDGKNVTISGFAVPLSDETEEVTHFMLGRRTPTCFFCPPGEANEVIEVWTRKPVRWGDRMITLQGNFSLYNDNPYGIFFRLKDAEVK